MSRTTRQQKIEIIRSETREQANTRQRVADILTDINEATIDDIIAGDNITIDKTDPSKPIINSTGSALTLEQARLNGNVLEGDVEIIEGVAYADPIRIYRKMDVDIYPDDREMGITFDYQPSINFYHISNVDGHETFIQFSEGGFASNKEFDKQSNRTAFAQLSDVYDANSYSTTETKTGGTWIDGKPIYTITKLTTDTPPSDIDTQFPTEIVGNYTIYKFTKTTD